MFAQDEFSYFGDEVDNDVEETDYCEGDSERHESFNESGKRVRGKDREWIQKKKFIGKTFCQHQICGLFTTGRC